MPRSLIAMILLLTAAALTPELGAAESPYVQTRDVVYYAEAHGAALVMDIFVPTGPKNGIGIIDVASGAWYSNRGKIEDHRRGQFYDIFCARGYTVFAIRPGSISRFNAFDMLANLKEGIRWVKLHATQYKIDPNRIGLTGASAGGHLACLASVRPDKATEKLPDTTVKATAVFFPPTDFLVYGGRPLDLKSNLLRDLVVSRDPKKRDENLSDEQMTKLLTQISPARRVTGNEPPFLFIHGNFDFMVPLQQSQRMVAELKKANVPAELIVKPLGSHPWPTIHEEVKVIADWFDKQLGSPMAQPPVAASAPAKTK